MASVPPNHAEVSDTKKGKAVIDPMNDKKTGSSASSSVPENFCNDPFVLSTQKNSQNDPLVWRMLNDFQKVLDSGMDHIPVTIFKVPYSIRAIEPESYTPQMIGLGPFHHLRPEVSNMQKKKIAAVNRFLNRYPEFKNQFIGNEDKDELKDEELRIRACYDIFLEFEGDYLVRMTIIDALFLSELLSTQGQSKGKEMGQNAILRDVMMLENQIPLFLLGKIAMEIGASSLLPKNLLGFCKAMSPFHDEVEVEYVEKMRKEEEEYVESVHKTCPHLLCLLYILIVRIPKPEPVRRIERRALKAVPRTILTNFPKILETVQNIDAPDFDSLKLPIAVLLSLLKLPYSNLRTLFALRDTSEGKSPQLVPSASSLAKAGVIFKPKTKRIPVFEFDKAKAELHLPVIKLGMNCKVILRNLVAFETLLELNSTSQPKQKIGSYHSACKAMEAARTHVLARYTKLMDGLLENANDVKILKDARIITGKLESDQDVVELFSGMSVSSGLALEDDTFKKLNNFYNNSPKIKICRFMSKCGSILYSCLKFIVAVVLLALTFMQTFCSVYDCHHLTLSGIWSNRLRPS